MEKEENVLETSWLPIFMCDTRQQPRLRAAESQHLCGASRETDSFSESFSAVSEKRMMIQECDQSLANQPAWLGKRRCP